MILNIKVETDADDMPEEELNDIRDEIERVISEWGHVGEVLIQKVD